VPFVHARSSVDAWRYFVADVFLVQQTTRMDLLSRKTALLALRSPALLVALIVVHGECSNISQTLIGIIRDVGLWSDDWPRIFNEHPSQVHYVFLYRIYGDLQTYTFLESL